MKMKKMLNRIMSIIMKAMILLLMLVVMWILISSGEICNRLKRHKVEIKISEMFKS